MLCDRCAEIGPSLNMVGVVFAESGHPLVYGCTTPGCGRMYDTTDGYYFMCNDQRVEENRQICERCHTARELAVDPRWSATSWICDCTLNRV
jgi:hypothetical protein